MVSSAFGARLDRRDCSRTRNRHSWMLEFEPLGAGEGTPVDDGFAIFEVPSVIATNEHGDRLPVSEQELAKLITGLAASAGKRPTTSI